MAGVDEILREAQSAVHSIGHGENRENRAHAARARSLARKIIRREPVSVEAGQARNILDRLDGKDQKSHFSGLRAGVSKSRNDAPLAHRISTHSLGSDDNDQPQSLLMGAQHALHESTYGESFDRGENTRRSGSLAKRIISEHPGSDEAEKARALLQEQSGDSQFTSSHKQTERTDSEGPGLWRGFIELNKNMQVVIAFCLFAFVAFLGFVPVLIGVLVVSLSGSLGKHYPLGTGHALKALVRKTEVWLANNKA